MKREYILYDPLQIGAIERWTFGEGLPVVSVTAGIHGDEQTSVYVARRLIERLEGEAMTGTVKIYPVCNPAAFRHRTRQSPFDGADLNRVFQMGGSRSSSGCLADALWKDTADSDFLLDLHCCGQYGSTYVMSMHGDYAHQGELAKAIGLPNVIQSSGVAGQLFVETNRAGRRAMLIEMKGGQPAGVIDLATGAIVLEAALRFLNHCGVCRIAVPPPAEVHFHGKIQRIMAPQDGLFLPEAGAGEFYRKGARIGTLGGSAVCAEIDGTVLAVAKPQYLFAGERIYTIAPPWEVPAAPL